MNFRKLGFKLIDMLQGSPVSNHLSSLQLNELSFKSEKDLLIHLEKACLKIKNEAVSLSSVYDDFNNHEFKELPVLNKAHYRGNLDGFKASKLNEKDLKEVVTSGSTGLPFKVFQDLNKVKRNSADTIFMAKKVGFEIGEKLFYLKIWNRFNKKTNLLAKIQNVVPIDVHDLSDNRINDLLNKLNVEKGVVHLLGYASALESISSFIIRTGFKVSFKVGSIISMSEALSAKGKNLIEAALGCKVYSRYSNVENGIIAQETRDSGPYFLINSGSYFVEILDFDNDIPVENGKLGRIVVTDFYNKGTFMLRYDTGDIGAKIMAKTEQGTVQEYLTSVEGRKMDAIFNTSGELISSFIITNGMWDYSELVQYQFIQESRKSYLFKLNVDKPFNREQDLINDFKAHLGMDAIISIEYVKEIPLLKSGKRKKVLNLMNL